MPNSNRKQLNSIQLLRAMENQTAVQRTIQMLCLHQTMEKSMWNLLKKKSSLRKLIRFSIRYVFNLKYEFAKLKLRKILKNEMRKAEE